MSVARRIAAQWFLLCLAVLLLIGAVWHAELDPLAEATPRNALVAMIMLLVSAPLDLRKSLSTPSAWKATAIAVAVNAGLAGPLAWLFGKFLPDPLAVGLVVAAIAPCTVASAVVWTRRGAGNDAVALTVTVITNMGCFLTLPAWTWLLISSRAEVDAPALGLRLLAVVVVPIAIGQAVRALPSLRSWCDRRRKGLGITAQCALLFMVFIGAVKCGALLASPETRPSLADLFWLIVIVSVVHTLLFAAAWVVARGVGCDRHDAMPAGIGGSQKTLAVGLDVALGFGGLAVLPMVIYHASQLLIDAVIVERLKPGGQGQENQPKGPGSEGLEPPPDRP